jgi:Domain of Unknown Function (DUF748)
VKHFGSKQRVWIAAAAVAALALAGALAWRTAVQQLKAGVESALGPRASVGTLELGWRGVAMRDLRVRGDGKRWPAADELRAERVVVVPALASLWSAFGRSGAWHISEVRIEGAYLSLLRTRDDRLRLLPGVLDDPPAPGGSSGGATRVRIGNVRLRDASIDLYDARVRQPAHRVQLQRLSADIGPLALPALDEPLRVELSAELKGAQRNGTLAIDGTLTPATRDAALKIRAEGVDLVALQPYLLRAGEGGVRRGTLGLRLDATVRKNRLHAPGHLSLQGLELSDSGGLLGTFAGVPRQAVIAAMSRQGRIEVDFTLEGRLDDPKFSLDEAFALRVASGIAEVLGVSLQGAVEGLGSVLKGLFGK